MTDNGKKQLELIIPILHAYIFDVTINKVFLERIGALWVVS